MFDLYRLPESVQMKLLEEDHEDKRRALMYMFNMYFPRLSTTLQLKILNDFYGKDKWHLEFPSWKLHELESEEVQMRILTNEYHKSDIAFHAFMLHAMHSKKLSKKVQLHILRQWDT